MAEISLIQDKPKTAERLAEHFEDLARQARAGEITGHSGIVVRPGGRYTVTGFQGHDAHAFTEMGMHLTCIMDIWRHSIAE